MAPSERAPPRRAKTTCKSVGKSWTKVDCGSQSTCAIGADDTLWCWGYGGYRQLGLGSNSSYQTPQEVGGSWKHISIGSFFSCGIKTDGTLWCWGFNSKGQCGPTALSLYLTTPTQVGSASDWTSVKTGYRHSCAHKTDGTLWCWGDGAVGQLGHGNQTQQLLPKEVSALSVVVDYGLGDWHSCARTPNGQVWCWGSNSELQLGKGDKDSELAPYEVSLDGSTTAALSVSARHGCALSTNGTLRCWGRNSHGQMGQGMTGNPTIPVVVGKPMAWTGVNAFGNSTTATGMDGKHYVWGNNEVGQLGTGDAWLLPGAVRPPDEPAMEVTP